VSDWTWEYVPDAAHVVVGLTQGLDAAGVEDPGRQPQQRVHVALLEQLTADGFAGAALEEHARSSGK
jgi:hypothetical protein